MTGLIVHPLRLRALDRMTVLRVPFREQPGKTVARLVKSASDLHWIEQYDNGDPLGVLTGKPVHWTSNGRSHKMPYAPGDYFVREAWAWVGDGHDEPFIVYRATNPDQGCRWNPARTMVESLSRHIVTLGNPVPCRLGEVDVVQQRDEGVIIEIGDEYRRTWDALYPKHPFSPDRWTWGYPMEVRRR